MDVFMDTNAVRGAGIDSTGFKALRAYLRKTRSRLFIPSVVTEELCAQRRMLIEELERDLETAYKKLRRLFPALIAAPPALDTDGALVAYREQLLSVSKQVVVLHNAPDDLAELVRRLAGRIPPASLNGEEARDVLIWLTLLPIARAGRVAFISADKKAFFIADKLRPELVSDLGANAKNVEAFQGLDGFLRIHHSRSSFINKAWVKKQTETKRFRETVEWFLDERPDFFEWCIEQKGEPSGYVSLLQILQPEVEEYFVSDVAPSELYVSATVWAELEVEVEFYARAEHEFLRDKRRGVLIECIYPCVRVHVQFGVVSNSVRTVTVSEIELA